MSSTTSTVAAGRGRLPVQGRDRRAALSALALLLVVLGALGAALVVYRTGHRTDVLIAAHDIKAGQQITAAEFDTARVAHDSGNVVPASAKQNFIGTYARSDMRYEDDPNLGLIANLCYAWRAHGTDVIMFTQTDDLARLELILPDLTALAASIHPGSADGD